MAWLIFTDLDGTLLDHETYSYAAASEALTMLRQKSVPLVLATSKTAAEVAPLRDELGFAHCPAIVENGAGLLPPTTDKAFKLPGGYTGPHTYANLKERLSAVPPELREQFEGFGDWSADDVAQRTGLTPQAAALAKDRAFSEPGIWSGSDEARADFLDHLAAHGITAREGGRFLTLSFGASKANCMREIINVYRHAPLGLRTIALGDAPNDVKMLEAADIGVIIENPAKPLPPLSGEASGHIIRSVKPGPAGWNETVLELLNA